MLLIDYSCSSFTTRSPTNESYRFTDVVRTPYMSASHPRPLQVNPFDWDDLDCRRGTLSIEVQDTLAMIRLRLAVKCIYDLFRHVLTAGWQRSMHCIQFGILEPHSANHCETGTLYRGQGRDYDCYSSSHFSETWAMSYHHS